jgi:hypothetical protein
MGAGFLDIETMVRKRQSETGLERLRQRIKSTVKQMIELAAIPAIEEPRAPTQELRDLMARHDSLVEGD